MHFFARMSAQPLISLQKWAVLAEEYENPGKATKSLKENVNRTIQEIEDAIAELKVEEK